MSGFFRQSALAIEDFSEVAGATGPDAHSRGARRARLLPEAARILAVVLGFRLGPAQALLCPRIRLPLTAPPSCPQYLCSTLIFCQESKCSLCKAFLRGNRCS